MDLDDAPAQVRRAHRATSPVAARTGKSVAAASDGGTPSTGSSTGADHEASDGVLTLAADSVAPPASAGSIAASPATTTAPGTAAPVTTDPAPRRIALDWVDESVVARPLTPADLAAASSPYIPVEADLLADAPHRSPLRAGVIVPTLVMAGVFGAYAATTLVWPLHAVAPTITAIGVQPVAAPAATPVWPAEGSAAISVGGVEGSLASAAETDAIASITKVVTALVVLDQMPLAVGEQGPEFRFGYSDSASYWDYRYAGESALDVPVGGVLTEYQMLEGMLIGSANNYADRLAGNLFPSDEVFANAAMSWLQTHGVPGVTIVEPTGMDPRNSATPEALLVLAKKALASPVIAEIVAKRSVELPGAGLVENTNGLLADPGVVGIKTGTLDTWNLLSAKDVLIGETPVRLFASVLGQPDDAARLAASRALYTQLEEELQLSPSVTDGTVTGIVETAWGERVDVVADDDASVVLWNGGAGEVTTTYSLGDHRDEGAVVGDLTVTGPLDAASVDLRLAEDVEGPSPWWRLTHPLELFGLTD